MSKRVKEDPDVMVVHRDRVRAYKGCVHPYEKNEPSGYVQWHEWAEKHHKTHDHTPCPDCGLYIVCTRKSKTAGSVPLPPNPTKEP